MNLFDKKTQIPRHPEKAMMVLLNSAAPQKKNVLVDLVNAIRKKTKDRSSQKIYVTELKPDYYHWYIAINIFYNI